MANTYHKSKNGHLHYVITAEGAHQLIGFYKSDDSSQITIQAEVSNKAAVDLIKNNTEIGPLTKEEFEKRLYNVLRGTIFLCKSHGLEVPGFNQTLEFIKSKV